MTDEEFVRTNWDNVRLDDGAFPLLHKTLNRKDGMSGPTNSFRVLCEHPSMRGAQMILSGNINTPFEKSHHLSAPAAWSAAAEFTRARLEEIRQVEKEIILIGADIIDARIDLGLYKNLASQPELVFDVTLWSRYQRILARLESIRDSLRAGMKQPQ